MHIDQKPRSLFFFFIFLVGLFCIVEGCDRKEQENATISQAPLLPSEHPPINQSNTPLVAPIRGDSPTVVPEEVQGKWRAVRILVDDKINKVSEEYVVNLHDQLLLPRSNLMIKVGAFLPDLKIEDSIFTSTSNELNNPGVYLKIYEDQQLIFNGWLFSMFPTIHPFQHEQYRVLLKGAIAVH